MGKFVRAISLAALATALPLGAFAQEASLADIRSELTRLYSDVQSLRNELVATGSLTSGAMGATPLDRMNAVEAELSRLTAKTEELEYRINRVVTDGTNRIGDLEFRLCELEAGCDIGKLGSTPSLGAPAQAAAPVSPPSSASAGAAPTGEQADFARASEALAQGDFRTAADLFAAHVAAFPAGSMTAEAHLKRGEAFEGLGQATDAASSYLDSFASQPSGAYAPEALFRLGRNLAALGQSTDACVSLGEVQMRFPDAAQVGPATELARSLGCL